MSDWICEILFSEYSSILSDVIVIKKFIISAKQGTLIQIYASAIEFFSRQMSTNATEYKL